jgi:hypothetical protein
METPRVYLVNEEGKILKDITDEVITLKRKKNKMELILQRAKMRRSMNNKIKKKRGKKR